MLKVKKGRGAQANTSKFKAGKMVEITGWKTVGTKLVDFSKSVEMEWEVSAKGKKLQQELFD